MSSRAKRRNVNLFGGAAMAAAAAALGFAQLGHSAHSAGQAFGNFAIASRDFADDMRRRSERDGKRRKKTRRQMKGAAARANRRRERARTVQDHKRDHPELYAMTNWQATRFSRAVAEYRNGGGRDPKRIHQMARRWAATPRRAVRGDAA